MSCLCEHCYVGYEEEFCSKYHKNCDEVYECEYKKDNDERIFKMKNDGYDEIKSIEFSIGNVNKIFAVGEKYNDLIITKIIESLRMTNVIEIFIYSNDNLIYSARLFSNHLIKY
jgi:hypothetical protein